MCGKSWFLGKKSMKKTMMLVAILLTLCLAASAFATPPKGTPIPSRPMTLEEAWNDPLYNEFVSQFSGCAFNVVSDEAFNYATSTVFFVAVRDKILRQCTINYRLVVLRHCELIVDPKTGPTQGSECSGGKALEVFIEQRIKELIPNIINSFDRYRVAKGLPPRPSFDK